MLKLSMLLFAVGFTIYFSDACALQENQMQKIERAGFFAELIIEGQVISTRVDKIQYFPEGFKETWITEHLLFINKIWAGYYASDTILVSIPGANIPGGGKMKVGGHNYDFKLGDRLLLFLRYDDKFSKYITYPETELLLINGDIYYSENKILMNSEIILDTINFATNGRNFGNLVSQSDLIIKAKPITFDQAELHLAISHIFKGDYAIDKIEILIAGSNPITNGSLWSFYTPKQYDLNSSYIFFLKKNNIGKYYPFAGINCIYKIHNEWIYVKTRKIDKRIEDFENNIKEEVQ